jgi:hypothetical protein
MPSRIIRAVLEGRYVMKFRSSVVAGAGVALLFGWLLATPAFAQCDADNAIYADDFEFLDGTWGDADDTFFVEDGALTAKGWTGHVNFSTKNEGADVCVDMTIADAPAPDNTAQGIVFWWADWDNYYYLYYWTDGSMVVRRVVKGKESDLFWVTTLAIKKGVGQTNQFELKLRPKDATIIINGTEVRRFKGQQPKDGGVVGVTAGSPDDKPATFKWDNFIVSAPTEASPPAQ